jgi:dihydrofolate reductase
VFDGHAPVGKVERRAVVRKSDGVARKRRVIVNIATSADGYIARPDGDLEWLTRRPPPKGFYGMGEFVKSIDVKLLGRRTYDVSVQLGAKFDAKTPHFVFSRQSPSTPPPLGVEFVTEGIGPFVKRLRDQKGKNIWLMGGGELIASCLDAGVIDEFIVSVVPVFIGQGIPLIATRHRTVPLHLRSIERFADGVAQLHYEVKTPSRRVRRVVPQ